MVRLAAWLTRLILIAAVGLVAFAVVIFCYYYWVMAAMIGAGIAYRRRRSGGWGRLFSQGTARCSNMLDLARAGLLSGSGLILGRCNFLEPPPRTQAVMGLLWPGIGSDIANQQLAAAFRLSRGGSERMIRVRDYVHLATFSPTGGGKGVSSVLPNLLSYEGSMFVLDVKGENFKLSAEHRSNKFGHRIVRYDPDGVCGPGGDTLNPLDFIDVHSSYFAAQCGDIANMLIPTTAEEREPHWPQSAMGMLAAFLAFVRACEPGESERNLGLIYALITSRDCYEKSKTAMQSEPGYGGVISRFGHALTAFKDRELGSVLSTLNRHLSFLNSPSVQDSLKRSSFDPRELKNGKTTVYLIVSPERLATMTPYVRLILGITLREIARMGASERHKILFMLDEFAHIGQMQALEDAFTLLRGYGIRLWIFLQSIEQLQTVYGAKAPVILGNIGTQQYFGINAYESADAISKRVGDYTILVKSLNHGTSWSKPTGGNNGQGPPPGNYGGSGGYTTSETGRRLFRTEEILTLRSDVALVFHKNLSVIPAKLLAYYNAPEFAKGGTGRNRRAGVIKSLVVLVALLFFGRLAFRYGQPVVSRVTGQVVGRRQAFTDFGPGFTRVPVEQAAVRWRQPPPVRYWVWPNGDWMAY